MTDINGLFKYHICKAIYVCSEDSDIRDMYTLCKRYVQECNRFMDTSSYHELPLIKSLHLRDVFDNVFNMKYSGIVSDTLYKISLNKVYDTQSDAENCMLYMHSTSLCLCKDICWDALSGISKTSSIQDLCIRKAEYKLRCDNRNMWYKRYNVDTVILETCVLSCKNLL